MSIVRSLLIKVGFVTDKTTIHQADRAIAGFKTRFAIAAGAAAYAFTKITSYFSEIAAATLDADTLARSLGISLVEFTKLQKAAESFRISDKQFSALFTDLNKKLVNFRYRLDGELLKLSQAFDFNPDSIQNVTQLFDAVISKLQSIENDQQRKNFAEIFFPGLGQQLSDLAKNADNFRDRASGFQQFAEELQKSIPKLSQYEESVRGLNNVWQDFVITISKDVIPWLVTLIGYLTPAINLLKTVGNFWSTLFKGDKEGFKESLKMGSNQLNPVFEGISSSFQGAKNTLTGLISDIFSPAWQRFIDYSENRDYAMSPAMAMGAPMVTNNIDVQVAPGTTEQQAQYMSDRIEQQVEESIFNTFRQIQNNNPMVE